MSGLPYITVQEERGYVAMPADLDRLAVVIGCASTAVGLSPFYLSGASAIAGEGYGDAVDALCQIIEQSQPGGGVPKIPAALYTCTGTTVGSHGTIDVTGVHGTSVASVASSTAPYGTYGAWVKIVAGGTVGTTGITYQDSLDDGRTPSQIKSLGTATSITIPNSGITFDFTHASSETLLAGDIVRVSTKAPAPVAVDIDAAFAALAAASIDFTLVICEFPLTAALASHVTSGLNALEARGKLVTALCRTEIPTSGQSDAAWNASISTEFASVTDSRINLCATYGHLTDAMTTRKYMRSDLAQWAADVARVERRVFPCFPADRPMANVLLVDTSTGATIGHDEGPGGTSTGLSNDSIGNRFTCRHRWPQASRREEVYSTVPWVLYASDERIRNLPTRRIANAMKRVAMAAGTVDIGADVFYYPANPSDPTSSAQLAPTTRNAIQAKIFSALSSEFKNDITNWSDNSIETGLVQVASNCTVSGGNLLSVSVTLAPVMKGYLFTINFKLTIKQ